jgi:hypothetical protein
MQAPKRQSMREGTNGWAYLVHYAGFNKRFDEWINESAVATELPPNARIGAAAGAATTAAAEDK